MSTQGLPRLKPSRPDHPTLLVSPGSCAVYLSNDKTTVFKQALTFDLDGCSPATAAEYKADSEESASLLQRERAIYERLGPHPRLLTCIESHAGGLTFEYLRNGDLRQYLHSHDKPTEAQQLSWATEAVEAIEYTHTKGVLIGDINARNFLVQDDLSIVLSDFSGSGIDELKSSVYPETRYQKVQSETWLPISVATEIFAIGSLLYEICTGFRPYDAVKEDEEVEALYKRHEFPAMHEVGLSDIISTCWSGGFGSVREVQEALANHSTHQT